MLLPYGWLKDFIDLEGGAEEVAGTLTMIGLEVEAIEASGGESVFDIGVTPNRPDCLSVLGVARELRAATGRELRSPETAVEETLEPDFRVTVDSPLCSRYTGRIIRGVRVEESPPWMRRRLELAGIRPINNVVDITNYVLLELGHPLHAFDLDTLRGGIIRVDTAGGPLRFRTLDGIEREVPGEALLIWDGERPVALAGVMGGLETEVSPETRNVFLESAYFDPPSIRRTSRLLGLRTESSYRFERGTDIEGLTLSLDRAASLMSGLAGGRVSRRIDIYRERPSRPELSLRYARIRRLLGLSVPRSDVLRILDHLGFTIISSDDNEVLVTAPSYRVDIQNETDLIEEVGRLHGYGRIPAVVPTAPVGDKAVQEHPRKAGLFSPRAGRIREIMRASGFNEAINYSFMNPGMLDALRIPEGDGRRRTVTLLNPLRKEDSGLRTTLLPSLLGNLVHNLNQGIRDIKLFEISRVFTDSGEELPAERPRLGAVYLYQRGQRLWEEEVVDLYYILKGVVEKLLGPGTPPAFRTTSEPFLHPNRSADVYLDDERLGYVGILSPETRGGLDLKHLKEDVGVIELEIARLLSEAAEEVRFSPLPRFPGIQRDIALIVDRSVRSEEVLRLIRSYSSELIEESWIFDSYEGEGVPAGKRSLGFSIVYRAPDRTLTEGEVEPLHRELLRYLLKVTGGELRS